MSHSTGEIEIWSDRDEVLVKLTKDRQTLVFALPAYAAIEMGASLQAHTAAALAWRRVSHIKPPATVRRATTEHTRFLTHEFVDRGDGRCGQTYSGGYPCGQARDFPVHNTAPFSQEDTT